MNKSQNQKLKRLLNVLNHFNTNITITNTLHDAANWLPKLDGLAADIIKHSQAQATSSSGSIQNKTALKATLSENSFFIAACTKVYARSTNDNVLYDKVNFSLPQLQKQKDIDLLNSANIIYDAANTNAANISTISTLTAAQLTQFKKDITEFTKFIPQAQQNRGTSKFHTQEIARLFAESDKLLVEIADYTELSRFSNPAFYNQYLSANKIGNAITRNRSLQINVTDKATQTPIYKADITITDTKGNKIADRKTSLKGNIYIQDLKESDYTINVVQAGYQARTEIISITDGTTFILSIELETPTIPQ